MDSETRRVLNDAGLLQSRKRHIERLQQLYDGLDCEPRPFRLNGLAKGGQILVGEAAEARVNEALRESHSHTAGSLPSEGLHPARGA
jgi:hypothetical protein